jgi:Zn-dependent peptidase ImmA (M78 family)/transcriptional regulator with XRE-family HTH domain
LLFDATRLRIARQAAMLRKKELAERIGVSAAAISQYESGTTSPAAKTVAVLSLALGVPADYFIADRPLGEAPSTTAHFRSLRATTQQERDRAFAHALQTWELSRTFEQFVRFPTFELPGDLSIHADDSLRAAEAAARATRETLGLGTGPIPNVVRLLESRGVVCTRLPAQTRRVFAFSCSFPARPVVVLAAERSHRAAGRFDAAHELAHLLLHHDEEPGGHAVERQAQAFASEFLAPASEIAQSLPRSVNWRALLTLKNVWGISIQALLFRARSLGIMGEHSYRRAVTELNARGWRTQEPGDDGNAEHPVMLSRALEVLGQQGFGINELARQCRLSPETVQLLVAGDERPVVVADMAVSNAISGSAAKDEGSNTEPRSRGSR